MARKKSGGKGWTMTPARKAYYASKKKGGGKKKGIKGPVVVSNRKKGLLDLQSKLKAHKADIWKRHLASLRKKK